MTPRSASSSRPMRRWSGFSTGRATRRSPREGRTTSPPSRRGGSGARPRRKTGSELARSYAQLAAVVFFIAGLVGLFAGQPSHHLGSHEAGRLVGNWADFDGVALHLTYVRDA